MSYRSRSGRSYSSYGAMRTSHSSQQKSYAMRGRKR